MDIVLARSIIAFSPSPTHIISTFEYVITKSGANVGKTPPNKFLIPRSLVSSIIFIPRKNVVSVHETAIISGLKFRTAFLKSSTADLVVFLKCKSSSSISKTGLLVRAFEVIASESSIVISSSNL